MPTDTDLAMYVLRSDFNRAVSFADKLRNELIEVRQELEKRPYDQADMESLLNDTRLLSERLFELERSQRNSDALIDELRSAKTDLEAQLTETRATLEIARIDLTRFVEMSDQLQKVSAVRDERTAELTQALEITKSLRSDLSQLRIDYQRRELEGVSEDRKHKSALNELTRELKENRNALEASHAVIDQQQEQLLKSEQERALAQAAAEEAQGVAHLLREEFQETENKRALAQAAAEEAQGVAHLLREELQETENKRALAQAAAEEAQGVAHLLREELQETENKRALAQAAAEEAHGVAHLLREELQETENKRALAQAAAEEAQGIAHHVQGQFKESEIARNIAEAVAEEARRWQSETQLQKAESNVVVPADDVWAPAALKQQLVDLGNQIRGELDLRREQVLQSLQEHVTTAANAISSQIATENLRHLNETKYNNLTLRAGLMSRFYMIASDAAILRRIREGNLLPTGSAEHIRLHYLDLLERTLTGVIYEDMPMNPESTVFEADIRLRGWDWPSQAYTMVGRARLRNVRDLAEDVLHRGVEGDFLEAGVWRGGVCIFLRGLLAAYGITNRKVWVADSFAGLPEPDEQNYPQDGNDAHHTFKELVIPLEEVQQNFAKYNLLDSQVAFLPGFFKDTLPHAPMRRLSILRLDGDMYGSTMETLQSLYSKVSPGGYVIVDDYLLPGCRAAVTDFREMHGIEDKICEIDGAAVYWQVRRKRVKTPTKASKGKG